MQEVSEGPVTRVLYVLLPSAISGLGSNHLVEDEVKRKRAPSSLSVLLAAIRPLQAGRNLFRGQQS